MAVKKEKENKEEERTVINVAGKIKNENRYYLKVSDGFRTAGFLLLVVFAVFAVIMLFRYGQNITYDNLVYLVRDFGSTMGKSEQNITEINFSAQDNLTFSPFKGGIVAAGSTAVMLWGPNGEEIASSPESYEFPAISAGDKYALVYSPGGRGFSVYNTVTRVMQREADGEIVAADMSDTGAFVLVVRSATGKYDAEIYGDNFGKIMTVHKYKHVTDAAISPDGKTVVLVSAVEGNVDFSAEVYAVRAGDETPVFETTVPSSVPLAAEFTADGVLCVIYDNKIEFYGEGMTLITSESLLAAPPIAYSASSGGVAVACRENVLGTKTRVLAFDTKGEIIYNGVVASGAVEIAAPAARTDAGEDAPTTAAYIRSGSSVIKITSSGDTKTARVSGDTIKLADTAGGLLVCTGDSIKKVEFEETE